LIKAGGFQRKKVDPNAPLTAKPLPEEPMSHLDLIQTGDIPAEDKRKGKKNPSAEDDRNCSQN
jgi:hypothetical protein